MMRFTLFAASTILLTATLGYSNQWGLDAHWEAVFVSEQFSDFMNLDSANDMPTVTGVIAMP